MILKALYDYYYRLGSLPARGTESKEIEFIIVIDRQGNFKRFESTRIDKKKCASFIVPKAEGRTSAPKANTLWDNGKYVLGMEPSHKKCNQLFIEKVNEIADSNPEDSSIQSLKAFYTLPKESVLLQMGNDPLFETVKDSLSSNFSFQLEGDDCLIAEKTYLRNLWKSEDLHDSKSGICLVTGEKTPLVRITSATPVPGNSPMAALVGMQVNSGYDSYGKSQAFNSPISEEAEFAYTSALKHMLGKDSRNKFKIGDRVFLFWGAGEMDIVSQIEDSLWSLSNLDFEKKDNPNEKLGTVEKLFKSIWSGELKTSLNDRFFILGLAPNSGRIAVVYWSDMTLKDFAVRMLEHFDDMRIVDCRKPDKQKPYSGIYNMLSSVSLGGKVSDVPSPLIERTLKAVVGGEKYPFSLFTSALDRIRAELKDIPVTVTRAAILKAYINRVTKFNNNTKTLTIMLDKNNHNTGYLCGRLAAVLEQMQSMANSGDSIRTTYLTAASATPAIVFPAMLALSNHHADKLSAGVRIFYEKIKQEIVSALPADGFPARFNLMDQGRFFVGYYHQRQELFTKKED